MADYANVRWTFGIITARIGGGPPGTASDPNGVKYTAEARGGQTLILVNEAMLPKRRISIGAKIVPAEPLDPCIIVQVGDQLFLHAITEGIPFEEACE